MPQITLLKDTKGEVIREQHHERWSGRLFWLRIDREIPTKMLKTKRSSIRTTPMAIIGDKQSEEKDESVLHLLCLYLRLAKNRRRVRRRELYQQLKQTAGVDILHSKNLAQGWKRETDPPQLPSYLNLPISASFCIFKISFILNSVLYQR